MTTIWFASDHHLHHDNIIKYSGRPFQNAVQMEDALVTYHNQLVRPQDHVYFLGDFSILRKKREWEQVIKSGRKFNGHKRLILGNHDHCPVEVYSEAGFEKIRGVWGGIDGIMLSHIPVHPRSLGYRFRANVHGHIHEQDEFAPVSHEGLLRPFINVCVENTDYRPITLDEVEHRIKKKLKP